MNCMMCWRQIPLLSYWNTSLKKTPRISIQNITWTWLVMSCCLVRHQTDFQFSAQRNIINLLTKESNITREVAKKVIRLGKAFKVIAIHFFFLSSFFHTQGTLSLLDTGYSEWMGFTLKRINKAQLEVLKLDLKVTFLSKCTSKELGLSFLGKENQ